MAKQTINSNSVEPLGISNMGLSTEQGDSWNAAVTKLNAMFTELYAGSAVPATIGTNTNATLGTQTALAFGGGTGLLATQGTLSNQADVTGVGNAADTTEDLLYTFALPASSFDRTARGVVITAMGSFAANAHTKTVKLYFGGSITTSFAGTNGAVGWLATLRVFKGSAVNTQFGLGSVSAGASGGGQSLLSSGTEPENAAITIKVTGQTATATASDVVANLLRVEAIN